MAWTQATDGAEVGTFAPTMSGIFGYGLVSDRPARWTILTRMVQPKKRDSQRHQQHSNHQQCFDVYASPGQMTV